MKKSDAPITEFYDDEMTNLTMFFSNGKKEFWNFDKVKDLHVDKCLFFFPRHFNKLKEIYGKCELIYEFKSASTISPVYLYDKKVLIALCPLGGPAATNLMEELIYVGIKYFIGTGSCGAIQKVDFNNFFIPDKAIRDEGTSYHYLPPSRFVETNNILRSSIKTVLKNNNLPFSEGVVWTTDAIYRETQKRIFARIKDGAVAVEMETASLASVAKARKVNYACLLYYSDFNNGKIWESRRYDKYELRTRVIKLAVAALLRLDDD